MQIDFFHIGKAIIGPTAWLLRDIWNTTYLELSNSDKELIRETMKNNGMMIGDLLVLRGQSKDRITVEGLVAAIGIWSCR